MAATLLRFAISTSVFVALRAQILQGIYMGSYITRVINYDRKEQLSVEDLAEYQKWNYRPSKYQRSLVSIALVWLTVLPSQMVVSRPMSGRGRWYGDQVIFVGDDWYGKQENEFEWDSETIFRESKEYTDITKSTIADICASEPQFMEMMLAICVERKRRNSSNLRRLVLDILTSSCNSSHLRSFIEEKLGENAFTMLASDDPMSD